MKRTAVYALIAAAIWFCVVWAIHFDRTNTLRKDNP